MGTNSGIGWTDHTFNPWMGCTRVSEGCVHCYAETFTKRFGKADWGPQAKRVKTSAAYWRQPLKWNQDEWWECPGCGWRGSYKDASEEDCLMYCQNECGRMMKRTRQRVFCASLADVFEDNYFNPLGNWRDELFELIEKTPNLDWLLLTKRPENVKEFSPSRWWPGPQRFPQNVWIGTTVENQKAADERISYLIDIPARIKFLSCEPLLEKVELRLLARDERGTWNEQINWVIVGGESGTNARPMNPDWVRSIRDQCQDAGVRFFFKQWGEHVPLDHLPWATDKTTFKHKPVAINGAMLCRVGKALAGRVLDGKKWSEFPKGVPR